MDLEKLDLLPKFNKWWFWQLLQLDHTQYNGESLMLYLDRIPQDNFSTLCRYMFDSLGISHTKFARIMCSNQGNFSRFLSSKRSDNNLRKRIYAWIFYNIGYDPQITTVSLHPTISALATDMRTIALAIAENSKRGMIQSVCIIDWDNVAHSITMFKAEIAKMTIQGVYFVFVARIGTRVDDVCFRGIPYRSYIASGKSQESADHCITMLMGMLVMTVRHGLPVHIVTNDRFATEPIQQYNTIIGRQICYLISIDNDIRRFLEFLKIDMTQINITEPEQKVEQKAENRQIDEPVDDNDLL